MFLLSAKAESYIEKVIKIVTPAIFFLPLILNSDFYSDEYSAKNTLGSYIKNVGGTDMKGRLVISVENNNSGSWILVNETVNNSYVTEILSNEKLDVRSYWNNAGAWNTTNNSIGYYRVNMSLYPYNSNIVLENDNNTLMTTSYIFTIDRDNEAPKYSLLSQSKNLVYRGGIISLDSYWTDNFQLSQAILSTNESGIFKNNTYAPLINLYGNESWSNFSISVLPNATTGNISWLLYGLDVFDNTNNTNVNTFEVWAWTQLNQSKISSSETYIGEIVNISCQVIDFNSSQAISGVNVTFYSDNIYPIPGGIGTSITGNDGWANYEYSYAVEVVEKVYCKIYDQHYFNVTNITTFNESINVTNAVVFLNVWDDTNFSTKYENELVVVYANYTDEYLNQKDGECILSIEGLTINMTKKAANAAYISLVLSFINNTI